MRDDHATPWWRGAAVLIVLLGLGGLLAWQVDGALAVRVSPADVPAERPVAASAADAVAPARIASIAVPPGDERLMLAAGAVADALGRRGAPRPAVGAAAPGPTLRVRLDEKLTGGGEAYRIDRSGTDLTVTAAGDDGASAGLYAVADRIRSGAEIPADGKIVAPRLGLRLTDLGAVGLTDDPAAYRRDDYSLNSDVVGDALLPHAPYVDGTALRRIAGQFRRLVEHSVAEGYNAVVIPGFLEYVTFGELGVYPAGDSHPARARAMVRAFRPVWRYAHDLGMKVFFSTDMLALSPPLRAYLERTVGGLHAEDDRLWRVYRAGLAELFDSMPFADGLMIRVGEGGAAYQLPGWDYSSQIAVDTPAAVRAMLRSMLRVAGGSGRDIIFRTWSVGIGIGDLHTNPDAYRRVLDGLDDPHLIVSTKYSLGDYYSYLPLNRTLDIGPQRRIVEFQSRREFEDYGALPDDLGVLHRLALRRFLAANPHVEGVWAWAQGGGPLRAGPRTLFLRTGFWQLYDLNQYLTARLAWDPDLDPARASADWVRRTFSYDPDTVAAICRALALSRDAVTKGLYIGPYARQSVHALGLEPPPMMWIFEWDIVTGDSATLDTIYQLSRDHLDEAVAEGAAAVRDARRMRDLVAGTDPAAWRDPVLRKHFVDTLDYQVDLFGMLDAYRTTVLRHAQWLDTGDATADDAWHAAAARYESARNEHLRRYGGSLDLPAYNVTAADVGLRLAYRDETMAWLARGLLFALLAGLLWGGGVARWPRRPPDALRALWTAATRPWRLGRLEVAPTTADRVLVWAVPGAAVALSRAIQTSFAAPAHLLPVLGAWLLFGVVLRLMCWRRDPFLLLAAVGGIALLRTALLLAALVPRGPGHYWFDLWTDPPARTVYVTVAFAAFLALFVSVHLVLRSAYGMSRARAAGTVLVAVGVPLAVLGGLAAVLGLERVLTVWNDQLALLPWGLHRILGITVYLEIPNSIPIIAAVAGGVVVVLGLGLAGGARLLRPAKR
jgi:glycosyl hydrolase family 67